MTIQHVNPYEGGPLSIRGHIFGQPDVEYLLYSNADKPYRKTQIARSFDRAEIEALKADLENPTPD